MRATQSQLFVSDERAGLVGGETEARGAQIGAAASGFHIATELSDRNLQAHYHVENDQDRNLNAFDHLAERGRWPSRAAESPNEAVYDALADEGGMLAEPRGARDKEAACQRVPLGAGARCLRAHSERAEETLNLFSGRTYPDSQHLHSH